MDELIHFMESAMVDKLVQQSADISMADSFYGNFFVVATKKAVGH
jgi:hypothetical protein